VRETYAFDCGKCQIVHTHQISAGLTTSVYNASRMEVTQATCGAAQLNHARKVSLHLFIQLPDMAYQVVFICFRVHFDVFKQVSVFLPW
jgi:hypothetical protein